MGRSKGRISFPLLHANTMRAKKRRLTSDRHANKHPQPTIPATPELVPSELNESPKQTGIQRHSFRQSPQNLLPSRSVGFVWVLTRTSADAVSTEGNERSGTSSFLAVSSKTMADSQIRLGSERRGRRRGWDEKRDAMAQMALDRREGRVLDWCCSRILQKEVRVRGREGRKRRLSRRGSIVDSDCV
jgi:hypothetical protein